MLGGNIPGSTQTLSIALFDQVSDGQLRRRQPHRAGHSSSLSLSSASSLVYARPLRRQHD